MRHGLLLGLAERGRDFVYGGGGGRRGRSLLALQWMLLQDAPRACPPNAAPGLLACDDILVLPAWPPEYDTFSFKLRAWHNTTVAMECHAGVLTSLNVTPPARRRNLVFVAEICRPA